MKPIRITLLAGLILALQIGVADAASSRSLGTAAGQPARAGCAQAVVVGGVVVGSVSARQQVCITSEEGSFYCMTSAQTGGSCDPDGCSSNATQASQCTGCASEGQYANCCQNIDTSTERTSCNDACKAVYGHVCH